MAAPVAEKPSYRRDLLLEIEGKAQQRWEAAHLFEATAGDASTRKLEDKYLATFPYPYMNGVLHLGHGFTLAKVDFECRYQRLLGKNVLYPFGYHCTGMPICAAADRLKREVKQYGNPPVFPAPKEPEPEKLIEAVEIAESKDGEEKKDGGKADKKKGGKGKVAAKASKETYQWNILREMGVPEGEIAKFQDARHWLTYFPPIATTDLKAFGLSADFRRSFITTDINPYYDSFIRWHFNTLRRRDKIAFGGRLSIFSPLDNQTCFGTDTRILTHAGFLFLDEIEARIASGEEMKYASYSTHTRQITYVTGELIRPQNTAGSLIDFTAPEPTKHLSIKVTGEHNMYVQQSTRENSSDGGWQSKWQGSKKLYELPHAIETAGKLLANQRAVRFKSIVENGVTVLSSSEFQSHIMTALGLTVPQIAPFLELYGFWLGDGSMDYYRGGGVGGYNAVTFHQKKESDIQWLDDILRQVGLVGSDRIRRYRSRDGKYTRWHIIDTKWFNYFDAEYGCKYKSSSKFSKAVVSTAGVETISSTVARTASPYSPHYGCEHEIDPDMPTSSTATTPTSSRPGSPCSSTSLSSMSGRSSAVENDEMFEREPTDKEVAVMLDENERMMDEMRDRRVRESKEDEEMKGELESVGITAPNIKSAKWFWWWVLKLLTKDQARLIVAGLHRADGSFAAGNGEIYTSSVRFRDELTMLLVHAGYATHFNRFRRAGSASGGFNKLGEHGKIYAKHEVSDEMKDTGDYSEIVSKHDQYCVSFHDDQSGSRYTSRACYPSIRGSEIKKVDYSGRIWCVRVNDPEHLIVAQSARRENGVVVEASKPVIIGNCADHDRSEGEGVDFQEYTLIKLKLVAPYPATVSQVLGEKYAGHSVILPAATLRPETMYGQTNCWVLPDGKYGIFEINDKEIFICSPKSALNMAYQRLSPEAGKVNQIGTITGKELLGCAVNAPHAKYEKLYCLPLTTINMEKGTAIVTSVPSDAPDDYAALMDLKNKPAFREKFGLTDEMVMPFEVVQIIETPGLGMQPAVDMCIAAKVASQNDRVKLDEIKDKVYKEGFAKGIMRVGNHSGEKVSEAKPKIKAEMIEAGMAYNYAEPDKRVVSRSGCECVVALADQWYLKYGEPEWQSIVRNHVENTIELYNPQTKKDFLLTVDWLHEWACSRSYGLGTFLPWDPQYVIESLSDSTIYMAYYTIAHLLQGPDNGAATPENASFLSGSKLGLAGIPAAELTDDVWNYVFLNKEFPEYPAGKTTIPKEKLDVLKNEFEYWYPLDLRVSGKDLIGNHLTMSLYNHAAVWPDQKESKWPRSFFTNGHIMLDSAKMSKNTGNFITLKEAVQSYSADATRFALADAGDGLEDANFERKSANAAILKLTKEEVWVKEMIEWNTKNPENKLRTGPLNFFDRVFLNELNASVVQADAAYSKLQFREALKYSWHNLQNERDAYKLAMDAEKNPSKMHEDVVWRYFEISAILLSPICPHFSQHIYEITGLSKQNGRPEFVAKASWPKVDPVDAILSRQNAYLRDAKTFIRVGLMESLMRFGKSQKPKAGEKAVVIEKWILDIAKEAELGVLNEENVTKLLTDCTLYVAVEYPEWQVNVIKLIAAAWDEIGRKPNEYPERKVIIPRLKTLPTAGDKKALENSTKFAQSVLEDLALRGAPALELVSPFNEIEFLQAHMDYILRDLGITRVSIKRKEEGPAVLAIEAGKQPSHEQMAQQQEAQAAAKALPGKPSPYFYKQ